MMGGSNEPSTGDGETLADNHVGLMIASQDDSETIIDSVIPPNIDSSTVETLPSKASVVVPFNDCPHNPPFDVSLPLLSQKRCIEDVSKDQTLSMNPSTEEGSTKKIAIHNNSEEKAIADQAVTKVEESNGEIYGEVGRDVLRPTEGYYDGEHLVEDVMTSNAENVKQNDDDYGYYGPANTSPKVDGNDVDDGSDNELVLPNDSENPVYALPDGVDVEWNEENTIATLSMNIGPPKLDLPARKDPNDPPRVCIVGRAEIRLLHGSLEVLGHIMTPYSEPVVICSPYWSSWLTLTASTVTPCRVVLTTTNEDPVRSRSPSFRIVAPTRPIVVPPSWKISVDDIVQEYTSLVPAESKSTMTSAAMFRTSLEGDDDDNDHINERDNNSPRNVCMITGAKGVGKSTLLRYMTNRLMGRGTATGHTGYQHVAILDADVGQPELAPPGLLRLSIVKRPLLHPPYWNLDGNDKEIEHSEDNDDHHVMTTANSHSQFEVVSSIFFGSVTTKADPTRYIAALQFLVQEYHQKVVPTKNIPLLINTDGWVKGLGYQILMSLIQTLQPTHICQIFGETRAQTFDIVLPEHEENYMMPQTPLIYSLQACSIMPGASLCSIPSVTWRNFRWATYFLPPVGTQRGSGYGINKGSPARSRMMMDTMEGWNFLSAKDLQAGWIAVRTSSSTGSKSDEKDDLTVDECRLACALAREKPYCVPMEAIECTVIGSDAQDLLSIRDGSEKILQALNGGIVSLCINPATNESLGYGILRSIDWNRRLLYVLVPPTVSAESLTQTKALIGGNLPLPLPLLFRGVYAESFPYLTTLNQKKNDDVVAHTSLGSEPMKSRNNIARRSTANTRG